MSLLSIRAKGQEPPRLSPATSTTGTSQATTDGMSVW